MTYWEERKYPIKACMGPALFETVQTFDSEKEAEEAKKQYASQITHREYIVTEEGEVLFCKHILFLR